jgi:2-polyprenyl-3-methyl-5-hydroxy-6-metoxy-1,4-benzoquinol methylase
VLHDQPKSILDIGIGFGSKGMLFREYTDIWNGKLKEKKTRIDGIEIFADYITPLQRAIYSNIYIGNVLDIIDTLGFYDLIYCGDVIEHFEKEKGKLLLFKIMQHSKQSIIVTPVVVSDQGSMYGNDYEKHLSQWTADEFVGGKVQIFNNVMVVKYGI